jgi:hypothetical protein
MRRLIGGALLIALLAPAAGFAADDAATTSEWWRNHVTPLLSDRIRGEFVDWFGPPPGKAPAGAQRYNFMGNQLRFGFRLTVPHVVFTVQGQDTRLLNLPSSASPPDSKVGALGPGGLYYLNTSSRTQGETFLKEGNLVFSDLPGAKGISTTLGRFEYSDGLETVPADAALAWLKRARIAERLVGPFGYTHVTRSFDGVKLVYDDPGVNVTTWGSRPTQGGFEVSANPELDIWLAGAALTMKQIQNLPPLDIRVFYLFYQDDRTDAAKVDNRPAAVRNADTQDIVIHSWGAHALTVVDAGPGRVDGLLWGVLQAGDWGRLRQSAWAYAVETGYQLPKLPAAPWVRAGYNSSSGDHDPNDNTHGTFFQVLPTARIYAQFPFFNLMNNQDLFGQLLLKPHQRVNIRTDYHWLRVTDSADLWYSGGGATNSKVFGFAGLPAGGRHELAHLVDTSVAVSLLKQLTAYVYYGHAFGQGVVKSSFAGAGADYGYVEMTYRY